MNIKGDKIVFDKVLLVDNGKDTTLGTPFIEGAKVEGEISVIGRAKKLFSYEVQAKISLSKEKRSPSTHFKVKITSIK